MIVYLLYSYDYDAHENLGVFATEAAAHAARRSLGHRKCGVEQYTVLSDPAQFGGVVTATVTCTTRIQRGRLVHRDCERARRRAEACEWQGWLGSPSVDVLRDLDYRSLKNSRSTREFWSVSARSASQAIAVLRAALGPRWTPKLDQDFSEDQLGDTAYD